MSKISRFASILLAALQLPLFSSVVTYGRTKKLIGNAGRLVSPKKDKDNIKNKKGNETKGKGQHKVGSMRHSKARDKVKSVVNGVVDDFFDRPIESGLKYLGIPVLCYGALSVTINEIYNCVHFPSRMKPARIIYLVENDFKEWPSEGELGKYCKKNFSADGVYNGDNWETKEKMMNYLAGILMTNYCLGPTSEAFKQVGYTIVDMLLFRSARDRVSISARRFLNNKSGSCFAVSCYLLLFMERLGVEARLAFFTSNGKCKDMHTGLVFKRPGKEPSDAKWILFDPVDAFIEKRVVKMDKYELENHLLVLEKIKKNDTRKISEMRCAEIEKGKDISDNVLSKNENYTHKVPLCFNW